MTDSAPVCNLPPSLETERLNLRPIALEDTEFVFRHFSDPLVTRYLMDEPPVAERAEAEQIVRFYLDPAARDRIRWVLVRKADGRPIGTCGYHKWNRSSFRAEIGYDLGAAFWGHGYMTEALRECLRRGFGPMALNRIDALVYVGNDRSLGLLQRLGFQQEGILRDYYYMNGCFHDHCLLSLLSREWV